MFFFETIVVCVISNQRYTKFIDDVDDKTTETYYAW